MVGRGQRVSQEGRSTNRQACPWCKRSLVLFVTRQDLRRHLWTDDTFVDFENGLNTAVGRLREALGDSADRPRYIETLPRVGYRFIAPVTEEHDPGTATAPRPTTRPLGRLSDAIHDVEVTVRVALADAARERA